MFQKVKKEKKPAEEVRGEWEVEVGVGWRLRWEVSTSICWNCNYLGTGLWLSL